MLKGRVICFAWKGLESVWNDFWEKMKDSKDSIPYNL